MSFKKLVLTITLDTPYIRHFADCEKYAFENEILFTAISKTYIPLINMLHKLEDDNVNFKLAFVISPVVCSLLDDDFIKEQYSLWLEKRIALGQKEIERCAKDAALLKNARECLAEAEQNKADFTDKYQMNLLKEFKSFADKGLIELLGTTGTALYVPHFADMKEILNAQVETGIYSHKHYFGSAPEGFYVPQCAYAKGFDHILRAYGINYTVASPATILFADDAPETGIFAPVRTHYSLVLFGKDNEYPKFFNNENALSENSVYKNVEKDIGFELGADELCDFLTSEGVRSSTLFRYWSKDEESVYDKDAASKQAYEDALKFVECKTSKLTKAQESLNGQDVCCVVEIPASVLGQKWEEGVIWLENVIRNVKDVELSTCGTMLEKQFQLPRVNPYPCSENGGGYGEDLLDNSNCYMIRYTRKMCERIVDLAGRFTDESGLKVRLLNLGARELMIAQDCVWAQMLHDGEYGEYVQKVFMNAVLNFTAVFDSLGTNTVSTEWLTKLEKEHTLFPWMNYRIFSPKV